MSKSSTVTVREKPVEHVATATVGGLTIHGETIVIQTDQRIELVDLTNRIMEFVRLFNVREGLVSLWSMHTTCALLLGHSLTLQVSGGEVVLGQWQRILMAELDGPRARSLRIQVWGISS